MQITLSPKAEEFIKSKTDTITIKMEVCGG
ncbi:MAG: hypothetical protein PWP65_1592 [Clostridia bacterium]|nr:hypothetical protein [Clostridia bacterium]